MSHFVAAATIFASIPSWEILGGPKLPATLWCVFLCALGKFALEGNIALSIEIGSSIAVQVCMVQMPVLVLGSLLLTDHPGTQFTMIFPELYVFAVLFSVVTMCYVFQDGRSDYFQGTTLVVIYMILCGLLLVDVQFGT